MKRILSALVVALLLWAQPASAALISSGSGNNVTGNVNTVGATLFVAQLSGVSSTPTISDSPSNSSCWIYINTLNAYDSSNRYTRTAYCINPTSTSGTHTFSISGTNFAGIAIAVFNDSVTALSGSNQGTTTGTTTATGGSLTPATTNNLMIALLGGSWYDSVTVTSPTYTIAADLPKLAFNYEGAGIAYLLQSSATSQNPTWTVTTNDYQMIASTAAFSLSGGGPPPSTSAPPCTLRLLGVGCEVPE